MAHAQKPGFVFRRNGRVHLNRRGRYFSRLLTAELWASTVVMMDTPCSEVVWRVLATRSIRQFPLASRPLCHRVPSHFNWTLLLSRFSYPVVVRQSLLRTDSLNCVCVCVCVCVFVCVCVSPKMFLFVYWIANRQKHLDNVHDCRLPRLCRWDLRFSEILRSVGR